MKTKGRSNAALLALLLISGVGLSEAASPPALVNYQGVLRDASDNPLSGTYDMTFRFWSASAAGDEILIDRHTAVSGGAVTVGGGLFNVQLGSGTLQDGGGPREYTSLDQVFRDYGETYLEIAVGAETLSPRVRITAAGYALNADHLDGKSSAEFIDTSASTQGKSGGLVAYGGVQGYSTFFGGYFQDSDSSGQAYVGTGDLGINASGNSGGGYFWDRDSSGLAYMSYGDEGISAGGNSRGGYFWDRDSSGRASVGVGDYGIMAYGNTGGGYFSDPNASGYAHLGTGDAGIEARGNAYGALFSDLDSSGFARVGYGDTGIQATGTTQGGYFADSDSTGYARVGYGDRGVDSLGPEMGGRFVDTDNSSYAYVGYSTYKIYGNPVSTSFVQNHPVEKDKVIVYSAPESDEVGVYTRGTARLKGGEARVSLGPTFRYVTNPDIGLTIHLTPVGAWSDLYVASKGTDAIVVRSGAGDPDAVFDYIVYGLRIGFEESSIVQEKTVESFIPSMKDHRQLYERHPDLRAFNALERFEAMQREAALPAADLARAQALKAAIHEYDPASDPPTCELLGLGPCPLIEPAAPAELAASASESRRSGGEAAAGTDASALPQPVTTVQRDWSMAQGVGKREESGSVPAPPRLPVEGLVEAGDVLVLDLQAPGRLRRCDAPADATVVGIALYDATATDDGATDVAVAATGFAVVKADAQFGAIVPGDLLVSSVTPGHAMKAPDVLSAGTVIGKALEPLEAGTGVIKVLVMIR